ncbi:hypothetical protein GGF32_000406 [Allomyces javanicus]|nr:hypothetical protein GGF32_000406 [Allomyces javanicus]
MRAKSRPRLPSRQMAAPLQLWRLGLVWLVWTLIAALALQPWQFVAAVPTNLTILVLLPLSDPGANPTIIRSFQEAMSVAPPAMNAIDPNHNYQLLFQDTGGVRVNAMNLFLNVTNQQTVHALVGEYASRVTLGIALAANNRRLWHCGLSSSMDFDNKIDFPFFFRPTTNDNQQGALLARFVASMSWRAVNILAVADPYGQSLSAAFSTSADQVGVSLYSLQQYLPGTTDFSVHLDTILASRSKIVMFFGFPSDAKLILRQAKAKGMVGPDWAWSDRRLADGMMFSALREDHSTPEYQALRSSFLAQFPSRSESVLGGFSLMYFDCFLALANGFRTMTTLHGEAAVQTHSYSATLQQFLSPFNGTTGSVAFSESGSRIVHVWQIMNVFNNSNRAAYVLLDSGRVDKVANPIFYGGSTAIPIDRPPLEIAYPQWAEPGVQALAVIRGLMILAMLGGMIFLGANRTEKQIRQLSLPFLLVISLGCVLILASEYILIGVPSAPACHASTIVFTFAYELVVASAIAKTYRIFRIFDNSRISKGGLKSPDLFRNVAMIMAVQAILFIIWVAAFPVWPTLVTTKTSLYYECRPTNFAGHWAIVGASFAFNGVMLLLVCYLAYKTRNVDSSYRETHCLVTLASFERTAYFIRAIAMLFAVGFAYTALVGRLIVAVWMDRRLSDGVTAAGISSTPLATAATDPNSPFKLKGTSVENQTGASKPSLGSVAGVPGAELGAVYPVLRRGGGLGFIERFTQTWRATQVYMNMPRGIVAISPPTQSAAQSTARGGAGGSTTARASVRKRVAGRHGGSGEGMGTVIPLAELGFDASPAGAPPACLELVHLGSGAAWVVQMTPEEVLVWSQYLKAVASVITTGTGSSSGSGTRSGTGQSHSSGGTASVAAAAGHAVARAMSTSDAGRVPLGSVFRNISDVMSVAPAVMSTIDPNHNYQLVFQDSASVRSTAVNAYTNVTNSQTIHALVGEYSSRVTLGLALTANPRKLWHCGVASAVDFDSKVDFPNFFRVAANDNQQGPVVAQFVYSMGWRAVNVFAVADPYGQSLSTTFAIAAVNLGIHLYTQQQYQPGMTQFGVYLDAIQASGSKIVLFMGFPGDFKLILQQAKLRGMLGPDWVWFGTSTMAMYLDTLTADSDKSNAQGMLFSFIREDRTGSQFQTLQSLYQAQFPTRSTSILAGFSLLYYDCLLALAYGFNKMTALYGDAAVQSHSYSATLSDFLVPFDATTGSVAYTAAGSRIADWQIQSIQGTSNRLVYQLWRNGTLDKVANPVFYGGSTTVPADRPPLAIVYPQWTDPGVMALVIIRVVMMATMLAGMAYLVAHRAEKQIRQRSMPFLLVISFGCILILGAELILIGPPASPSCHASSILLTFGFELVIGSAVAKTYRIAAVLSVQGILFIIWVAAFPVWPELVATRASVYYRCTPSNVTGHWAIIGLSFAFNGMLLLAVCFLAYKTRNVDSSYRETHWILYTAQNVFVCSVVIIPLSFIDMESFATTAYAIRAVAVIFAVAFAYLALVGRLIIGLWVDKRAVGVGKPEVSSPVGMFCNKQSSAALQPLTSGTTATTVGGSTAVMSTPTATGFELAGQFPVLRRGSGLGFVNRFLQTWTATVVYANLARGIISLTPPAVKPVSKTGTKIMSTVAGSPPAIDHPSETAGKTLGAAMPLAQLAFDPSPAGTPAACLELVHLGTGASWVVQMNNADEVVLWAQHLKAVASSITTGATSSGATSSQGAGTTNRAPADTAAPVGPSRPTAGSTGIAGSLRPPSKV